MERHKDEENSNYDKEALLVNSMKRAMKIEVDTSTIKKVRIWLLH